MYNDKYSRGLLFMASNLYAPKDIKKYANEYRNRSFLGRLWHRFAEKRYFKKELLKTDGDKEKRFSWVERISEELGRPYIASLLLDTLIKNASDLEFARRIVEAFITTYPTLATKERAPIFKKLVNEFCKATNVNNYDESKSLLLGRILTHIGKESKTAYKHDEGPIFIRSIEKLTEHLYTILDNNTSE